MPDYYELLEVTRDDPPEKIKKAYKRAVLKYHPDISRTRLTEESFKMVLHAYQILRDPQRRSKYDHDLSLQRPGTFSRAVCTVQDTNWLSSIYYQICLSWRKFPRCENPAFLNPDKTIQKLGFEELKKKFLFSSNYFVRLNAAAALRYLETSESVHCIISALPGLDYRLAREVLNMIGGIRVSSSIYFLLSSFSSLGTDHKQVISRYFFSLGEGMMRYVLGRVIREGREPYAASAKNIYAMQKFNHKKNTGRR